MGDWVVFVVGLIFLSGASEEESAVVFPWGFLLVLVVPLAGLWWVLGWLARISKSWQRFGVEVLLWLCPWTQVE